MKRSMASLQSHEHYSPNDHQLVFNWRPQKAVAPVQYVILNNDEAIEERVQSKLLNDLDPSSRENIISSEQYKFRILIVDDQSFNIDALKIILK